MRQNIEKDFAKLPDAQCCDELMLIESENVI